MIHVLRAAPELFRVSFARLVAYRAEMTIWILTATLPLVMLALWNAVAAEGTVAGFGQGDFARYFAATLVVRQLTGAWIVWQLNWEIRSGQLSARLLRPMNPLVHDAIWMLTAVPFRLLILAPILAALLLWRPDIWYAPSPARLALFGVSVLLAWAMSFLVQVVFGLLSFWLDQSEGLFGVWFAVWALLSGYVAPLAVFPDALVPVLTWLPFAGMLAVPVEILGGFAPLDRALGDVARQLGWTVLLALLARFLWKRGVRNYGAYGA